MSPSRDIRRAENREWPSEVRSAAGIATLLPFLLVGIDAAGGQATFRRVLIWTALGLILLCVLWPTRVLAVPSRLTAHGLLSKRHVRTDRLTSVVLYTGVTTRLLLRDADGCNLEVDPRVLISNPQLWYLLEQGIQASINCGALFESRQSLHRLSRLIDGESTRLICKISGL